MKPELASRFFVPILSGLLGAGAWTSCLAAPKITLDLPKCDFVTRKAGDYSFQVGLDELGGKLVALYPVQPARIEIATAGAVRRGGECRILVTLADGGGNALPGLQPVRLIVTDAAGRPTEYRGYYCAENGKLSLPLAPALNDQAGTWKVVVEDLTAGIAVDKTFKVR
jgi:hypothetical protein